MPRASVPRYSRDIGMLSKTNVEVSVPRKEFALLGSLLER